MRSLAAGTSLAYAEAAAWSLFNDSMPPSPEAVYAAVRHACPASAGVADIDFVWDLVLVRLAEMQAAADGYAVPSINERAA